MTDDRRLQTSDLRRRTSDVRRLPAVSRLRSYATHRWLGTALFLLLMAGCSQALEERPVQAAEWVQRRAAQAASALLKKYLAYAPDDRAARNLRVRTLVRARAVDEALEEYQALWKIQGNPRTDLLSVILTAYLVEEVEAGGSSRLRAAPLVAHQEDPALRPLLYDLASKGDRAARIVALDALSRAGTDSTISFLASFLADPDPYIRAQAARGLGQLGADTARSALDRLTRDEWDVVRFAAAEGLVRLGDRKALAPLVEALKSPQVSIRMRAAEVLGALAVQEAVPTLLEALNDADRYVRLYAAQALVELGRTEGLTVLHLGMQHPSLSVRLYAAEVFSNLQDETPGPWLRRVVADPALPKGVRLNAAWILGRLDDPSGVPHIREFLHDADPHIRLRAAWTLGEIGDPHAAPVLRSALRDQERAVRIHATWALNRLLRHKARGETVRVAFGPALL